MGHVFDLIRLEEGRGQRAEDGGCAWRAEENSAPLQAFVQRRAIYQR